MEIYNIFFIIFGFVLVHFAVVYRSISEDLRFIRGLAIRIPIVNRSAITFSKRCNSDCQKNGWKYVQYGDLRVHNTPCAGRVYAQKHARTQIQFAYDNNTLKVIRTDNILSNNEEETKTVVFGHKTSS